MRNRILLGGVGCVLLATVALTVMSVAVVNNASAASGWVKKPVGKDWTWFEDYLFLWASYTLVCSPGCTCQAGLGIKAFGEPRGEKVRFQEPMEVLTVGAGAIHIRKVGGDGECYAAMAPGKQKLVPITW